MRDARPTIADLRTLIRRPGARQRPHRPARPGAAPGAGRAAGAAQLDAGAEGLDAGPAVRRGRTRADLVGWLRDFGQGASNYDANGHFARIQPIFNAYSFADNPAGGTLTPIAPSQRLAGLQTGFVRRCPGAASQPRRGRLGAVARHERHPRLRPVARPPRPVKRVLAIGTILLAASVLVVFATGATTQPRRPYKVRAIFENAFSVIPGEDVKVAGRQGRQGGLARRDAATRRPPSSCASTGPASRTSAATPSARSARSR